MVQLVAGRYALSNGLARGELSWWLALTLDAHVAGRLPECDVFVGISGSGLKTGRLAQKRGGKYICDRGSAHIRWGDRMLTEEFKRWGEEYEGVYPKHLTREESEYDQADAVTVPSEFARRTYIEMGMPTGKVRKVSLGSDLSRFTKVADPALDSFDVLFVGQISFRKGIPYLLEAFEKLRHPRKTLTLAGGVLPEIKNYLARKPLEKVTFVGPQAGARLKELMSRSHVLVLPSVDDGFGMVIGEAMACGCPVITSENCGGGELFDDAHQGFIVPIRDSNAIRERLEWLAQDPGLRDAMGAHSLERVVSLGGWDTYGRDYVAVLESLTAPGAQSGVVA